MSGRGTKAEAMGWATISSQRFGLLWKLWCSGRNPAPMSEYASSSITERKVTTKGFPYVIRYRVIDEFVVVMAVYHQRRRPDFGSDRSV